MTNLTIPTSFPTPITSKAIALATIHKNRYQDETKSRRVYLNTLAVYAIASYCKFMGIEFDLETSDSLDPIIQGLSDVADLNIDKFGKVECRPFLPGEQICIIPPLTWSDRLGYFAVKINEEEREATIVGFISAIPSDRDNEEFSLKEFDPPDSFLDLLERWETGINFIEGDDEVAIALRERLSDLSISEIVVQLEKLYSTEDLDDLRFVGGDFLHECATEREVVTFTTRGVVSHVREKKDSNFDLEEEDFQDLAEDLFEKLDEIWGSNS